jgi:hypothetical protein
VQAGGIRLVQFVEQREGTRPGGAGLAGAAGRLLGVAQMGEDRRLVAGMAEAAEQLHGAAVADDRLIMLAELVPGVAETVQSGGLPVPVGHLPEQHQRLLAGVDRPAVITQQGMAVAGRVQGGRLAATVPGGAVQRQRPLNVIEGLLDPALLLAQEAEVVVGEGLARPVAGAKVEVERVL